MTESDERPAEYWCVELEGWNDAFEDVKYPPKWDFAHDEQRHYLTSSEFADVSEASVVIETATRLVERINVAARRTPGSRLHLSLEGAVTRATTDGRKTRHVHLAARFVVGISLHARILQVGGISKIALIPFHEVLAQVESFEIDRAIHSLGDPPGDSHWAFNLWKFYDVLKKDVEVADMIAKGWTTTDQLWSFRTTVNNPEVSGDQARHGVQTHAPHPNPMNRSAAETFAWDLFEKWVREKFGRQQTAKTKSSP